jgi:hypothetical protein
MAASFSNRYSMSVHACPDCGGAIFFGAKRCSYCRPEKSRDRLEVAVAACLLFALALGAVYAAVLLSRDPNRPSLEAVLTGASRLASFEFNVAKPEQYGWIAQAMDACKADAAREPSSLHFLVVPLTAADKNDVRWATKPTAAAANAELLNLNDTLDGLRRGDLQLYPGEYVFRITSLPAGVTYKWNSATGVARFSSAEGEQLPKFKIAFQIGENEGDTALATELTRTPGSCFWTGALIMA